MKIRILANLSLCYLVFQMGCTEKTEAAASSLKTAPQKLGYAFGMSLGNSLKKSNIPVDADFLGKAVKAQLTAATGLMTTDEVNAVLTALRTGPGPTNLPTGEKRFKSVKEEIGYAIGWDFGQRMKASGLDAPDADVDSLVKGVQDMMAGNATLLTSEEVSAVFMDLADKVQAKQVALRKAQDPQFKEESEKNMKEETEFMAKNKTAPGVTTLTNGLQYSVITAGKGPIPKPTDSVKVNYRGTFLDGKQFDASPPGQPFSCSLSGGVIRGWLAVLKRMPVGSKWNVFISSELAYGPLGRPGIPPNSALIFEMELVSIDPPK